MKEYNISMDMSETLYFAEQVVEVFFVEDLVGS